MKRNYGWVPDLPDQRDFQLAAHRDFGATPQPQAVDLSKTKFSPPIYDQKTMGACVGNSTARMFRFMHRKLGLGDFNPSRLFIYNEARIIEGTLASDSGSQIRDAMAVQRKLGVCPESSFRYTAADLFKAPPKAAISAAKTHLDTADYRINNLNEMLQCLADGFPFCFGFTVYESFEGPVVAKTGIVPMPSKGEKVCGGHAICCEGYDKGTGRLRIANSWGTAWGQAGFFEMPFDYVTNANLWADAWTLRQEEA